MVKHTGGIFSPLESSPFVQGVINDKTVIAFLRCKRTNVTIDDTLRKKRSKAQPVYTGVRKKTIICVFSNFLPNRSNLLLHIEAAHAESILCR